METRAIDQVLSELRAMSEAAGGRPAAPAADGAAPVDFAAVLEGAMQQVSQAQTQAQQMAREFSSGSPNVNLQDVMINLQKANLSFQQMVQVRNRLVSAYQDIMNMPV
jgi:flagellar hook-basal body complex protein FliE